MGMLTNPKHEHFAQLIASGANQTEAATAAGYSERSARKQGSRMQTNGDIVARIEELKARTSEKAVTTSGINKAWVITRLKENADRAMQAEPVLDRDGRQTGEYTWQPNAANRALELIGKELGMFVDRKEIALGKLAELSADDLVRLLDEINGQIQATNPLLQ